MSEVKEWPHGTAQRYWAGCRCSPCRAAKAKYQKQYRNNPRTLIDSRETKEHIQKLGQMGIGRRTLSALSGVHIHTLCDLIYRNHGQILACTAHKILAVDPALMEARRYPPRTPIDSRRYAKMLEEMKAYGLSVLALSEALKRHPQDIRRLRPMILAKTAVRIEDLHWKLWKYVPHFRTVCDCVPPREVEEWLKREA